MSITILHGNFPWVEDSFKKLHKRTDRRYGETSYFLRPQDILEIEMIREYCAWIKDERIINALLSSSMWEKLSMILCNVILQYYKTIQTKECLSIVKKKGTVFSNDLTDLYTSKDSEFKNIQLSSNDTVLCIESWPLAKTAKTISTLFWCKKILWLNKNHESTVLANELFNNKESNTIEFITTDSTQFNYSGIDRIYIPNIVHNKDSIISQIIRTATKNTHILIQKATGLSCLFYKNHTPSQYLSTEQHYDTSRKYSTRELHQLCL